MMAISNPRIAQRRARGFTLIEMVVVVAIVGILAAAAQPMLKLAAQRQKEYELHRALRALRGAIDAYHQAVVDGKVTVDRQEEIDDGYPASLQVLADGVRSSAGKGRLVYFLRSVPRDPFADPALPAARTWGLRSYASSADAPQPGRDVFDVFSLTPGDGLDGQPYRSW